MSIDCAPQIQQKWEYHYFEHRNVRTLCEQLSALGEEGWELVSVLHRDQVPKVGIPESYSVFLKRPKS